VLGGLLLCQAEPGVVRERLASRREDASDADWTIYLKAMETWEEPGPRTRSALQTISTGGSVERALSEAVNTLRRWNLSS
jgi:predicted kinase